MIPLRDSASRRRLTPFNTILIAANVVVFIFEIMPGSRLAASLPSFALIPARVAQTGLGPHHGLWPAVTLITSMFLHGGLMHIAGNMLYLFIFGPAVEEKMGLRRYCGFYMASGIIAGVAMVWADPSSRVPVIGASGAIAGVLGAHLMSFPRSRILTLIPLFPLYWTVEVPSVLYLIFWFALQLYWALHSAAQPWVGGIAWWAHVGGFLFGVGVAPLLARSPSRKRRLIR